MPAKQCHNCGGTNIETDMMMGHAVCTGCYTVVEENIMVSEVGFAEGSGGRVHVSGTFVRAGATGFGGRGDGESLEKTKKEGKDRIRLTADTMGIEAGIWRQAQRFFSLLVDSKFNKGRKSEYLIASCLYLACRIHRSDKMMIDFSERLEINVFELGATYMKLRSALELKEPIPEVDPAIYNIRFAHKLDFGTANNKQIAADATRLVRRFRADWMTQGRRPAGVCGACLIIAARMSSFWRSPEEVAQVVKVSADTIKRRLVEFAKTEMGSRTVAEWREMSDTELDRTLDGEVPPIVKEHRRKERLRVEREAIQRLREQGAEIDEGGEGLEDIEDPPAKRARKGKDKLSKRKEMREGRGAGEVEGELDDGEAIQAAAEGLSDNDDLEEDIDDATLDAMEQADFVSELNSARDNPEQVKRDLIIAARQFKRIVKQAQGEDEDDIVNNAKEDSDKQDDLADDLADFDGLSDVPDEEESEAEEEVEAKPEIDFHQWDDPDAVIDFVGKTYFTDEIDALKLTDTELYDRVKGWLGDRDPKTVVEEYAKVDEERKKRDAEFKEVVTDLSYLDDPEVDAKWQFDEDDPVQFEELLIRTRMWTSANGAWYEKFKERKAREALNEKPEKKKAKKRKAAHRGPYNSAREAMENIASVKKFSDRIDYNALQSAMNSRGGGGDDDDYGGLEAFDDEKQDEKQDEDDPNNW